MAHIQRAPFDFIVGGSIGIAIMKSMLPVAELDFAFARLGYGFTKGQTNQRNLRYQDGAFLVSSPAKLRTAPIVTGLL